MPDYLVEEYRMRIRVFKCANCGHKMRLFGQVCGRCRSVKPLMKNPVMLVLSACGVTILAVLVAVSAA